MYNNLLGKPKSDIVFYQAYKQVRDNKISFAVLKTLLLASMLTLIILTYNTSIINTSPDQIQAFVINAIASFFGLVLQIAQLCIIFNGQEGFLKMAEANSHTVSQELTSNVTCIQDCVSTKIFVGADNFYESDLNEPTKKTYIAATVKALTIYLSARYRMISSLIRLHSIISIVSIIYSIIILAQKPDMDTLTKAFLITYVVLVGLSELVVIFIFILVLLVPLICCLCCVYFCCCRKAKGKGINAVVKNANMEDILNCDGTCSICYQNIGQNEPVYVLPCSVKHIFHKDCLGHWARVKNTCPICRAEIPMNDVSADPVDQ